MTAPSHDGVIFLRAFGIVFLIMGWLPVLNPEMKVVWKGGNRAPLSRKSKWVSAVATTAWCLSVWGVTPGFCMAAFMVSVVYGIRVSDDDRLQYFKETGIPPKKAINPPNLWVGLCVVDAVLLSLSLYAVVRDHYWPQVRRDDEVLRYMAWVLLGIFLVGAVVLYRERPKKDPRGSSDV